MNRAKSWCQTACWGFFSFKELSSRERGRSIPTAGKPGMYNGWEELGLGVWYQGRSVIGLSAHAGWRKTAAANISVVTRGPLFHVPINPLSDSWTTAAVWTFRRSFPVRRHQNVRVIFEAPEQKVQKNRRLETAHVHINTPNSSALLPNCYLNSTNDQLISFRCPASTRTEYVFISARHNCVLADLNGFISVCRLEKCWFIHQTHPNRLGVLI